MVRPFFALLNLIWGAKVLPILYKSKEYSVNMGSDYSSPREYFRGVVMGMGLESDHSP
jgi:hypothetical protein